MEKGPCETAKTQAGGCRSQQSVPFSEFIHPLASSRQATPEVMSILLLTSDLACSSQVSAAGARTGSAVEVVMNPARLMERAVETSPDLVLLDLNTPLLDCGQVVGQLKALATPPKVIAFGPHVHEARLTAAQEAGCDRVLARGQFYAQVDAILAQSR